MSRESRAREQTCLLSEHVSGAIGYPERAGTRIELVSRREPVSRKERLSWNKRVPEQRVSLAVAMEGEHTVRNAGQRGALDPARVSPWIDFLDVIDLHWKWLFLVVIIAIIECEHAEDLIKRKKPGTAVF